jgi:predicted permease
LLRWHRFDHDLEEEMRLHREMAQRDQEAKGVEPTVAAFAAKRAFGSAALARDQARDVWFSRWLQAMTQDLRFAARALHRSPTFTLVVVATLAIGTGLSTAMFSVAYGVALRPLPYPDPDRLIRVYEADVANGRLKHEVSVATFHEWREGAAAIESAALYGSSVRRYLAGSDDSAITMSVSPAFFDVLGVRPLLGPGFQLERDYTRVTADQEAILSHAAWRRLLGGRPDVVGHTLEFTGAGDNDVYRIVGVMPENFAFLETVDLWRPTKIVERPIRSVLRTLRYDHAVMRLRPEGAIDQARAELELVSARLAREFPTSGVWSVTVEPLHDAVVGTFGTAAWMLIAGMTVVLLVTGFNVAGLLMARAAAQQRQLAIRVSLGAGVGRLLTLSLAEAAILSTLGVACGLLLAMWSVLALKAAAPPGIPRLDSIAIDTSTLLVVAGSAVLAIVIFTLAPLRLSARQAVAPLLHAGTVGGHTSRIGGRAILTMAQCAGATALVILAVLLTRSFSNLMTVDLGWDREGVLAMDVYPPMPPALRSPWFRYVEWSDRLIGTLEAHPVVEEAALTTQIPLSPTSSSSAVARGRGDTSLDDTRWPSVLHHVTDGYFDVMRMRIVAGRPFGQADRFSEGQLTGTAEAARSGVAIVSRSTARALWPGQTALGQMLWLPNVDRVGWRQVVGVVDDIQFHTVGEASALHVFVPWTQFSTGRPRLIVRGDAHETTVPVLRDLVQRVEPGTRIEQIIALDDLMDRATAQPRFSTRIMTAFGMVALTLAAVGLYGTLSYLVGSRTREIGIRLALGAQRHMILAMVLVQGLRPAIIGGTMGVLMGALLARLFGALLFEVEPLDALSFTVGMVVLSSAALAAAFVPARRATKVDPIVALQCE